jgi:signal transduction histidine kinase
LKKFKSYLPIFLLLFAFSCKQNKEDFSSSSKIDSLVDAFTWEAYDSPAKDTNAVYLNKLLASKNINTRSKFKIYSSFCAYHYRDKRNLPKALLYADSMILLVENAGGGKYLNELAQGHYSKGDVLFALGKYDESFDHYYTAKRIMAATKDNCTNSDYSYRIGMVLYKQGKYAEASLFFRQGFEEAAECPQDFPIIFRRQELLNNAALCYAKRGLRDSALLGYNLALSYINKHDTIPARKMFFEVARGVVYGNIGGEYFANRDYGKAEEFLLKSIAINIRPRYENNDAALTQVKLVRLYLLLKSLKKAEITLAGLRENIGKNSTSAEVLVSYHDLMSQYFEAIGQNDMAFNHLKRFRVMTDSIQKQVNQLNATAIDERFKDLDSQNEIRYLKRDAEIQKMYLYITIVFSLMTIIIVLLIYFFWKRSRKNIKVLTILNDEISMQKVRLEKALEELENTNNDKDRILRTVAHDLRNPIGGISSLVSLIIEDEQHDEETVFKHKLIKDTCVNALNLINELIEVSAHNQSETNYDRKTIDIVQLIVNAIELLKFKANEKKQSINFIPPEEEILVHMNEGRIFRVLNNLISNAIKFSDLETAIKVSVTTTSKWVSISVIDSGIGIPDQLENKIFQVFTSAKREGTQGEKSYGLGLSISKQIIEAHKGQISYERNPDGGSIFSFKLPLA